MLKAQTFSVNSTVDTFVYEQRSDSWALTCADATSLTIYSVWRLLKNGRLIAVSTDHGHFSGLASPLNLAADTFARLRNQTLVTIAIKSDTGDLAMEFADGHILEVFVTSMNYECYDMLFKGERFIATGGGG